MPIASAFRTTLAPFTDVRGLASLALPALTVALGMQMLRGLLPLTVYVLRDRIGWQPHEVGILALAIFATGFLVGPLYRLVGVSRLVAITAGLLALLRLASQAWRGDPLGDLYLAIAGLVLFIIFLHAYLCHVRSGGLQATGQYGLAVLFGIALDTLILGAFGSHDMFWQGGALPLTLVALLVAGQLASLGVLLLARWPLGDKRDELSALGDAWGRMLPWLAIGPFLFLQVQVFQNMARLGALTAWDLPQAFGWTALANAIGLAVAALILSRGRRLPLGIPVLLAVALVVSMSFERQDAAVAAVTHIVGQVSASALLVLVFASMSRGQVGDATGRAYIIHGLGMVAMVILLFAYYVTFDLEVPFDRNILMPVAGVILALAALSATRQLSGEHLSSGPIAWVPSTIVLTLLLVPLAVMLVWGSPDFQRPGGYPVRVMTYNLHNGFNTQGELNMEAIARGIEDQDPDVVGLQEVSRGWAINGPTDMAEWLSHRLDMPYVFGPTAGPMWGNALLSRYPIVAFQAIELSPRDLRLQRGFILADIDVGDGQLLRVLNTHWHHSEDEGAIRQAQAFQMVEYLEGSDAIVLIGDLNARPNAPEVQILRQAGLQDVLDGVTPRFTSPSDVPEKQIDYILISNGLTITGSSVPRTTASDHLPILADVSP